MNVQHFWFRSGSYSLFAHLDCPDTVASDTGLLIVPPFGWEDVCSHRPVRSLCRLAAKSGIPALRFDLPGTGDSSGSALSSQLVPAWIQSVSDAAAQLIAATGVKRVSILGMRLGALLGLAAACAEDSTFRDLILWGGAISGRALLREMRALVSLESVIYAEGEEPPPQPIPGTEIAGFLLSPETEQALERLDLSPLPLMPNRRVMLLSRDALPAHKSLTQALEKSGCELIRASGLGYSDMMSFPHPELPASTTSAVLQFLKTGLLSEARSMISPSPGAPASAHLVEQGVIESVCLLPSDYGSNFAIISQTEASYSRPDYCFLFLNTGLVRHIGSNRMWVEAARRWASQGVCSARLDFAQVGESDGGFHLGIPDLYQGALVDQVGSAIDLLHTQTGCRHFIAVGLCSGAYAAFQALIHNPSISGAILLNPRLFFWDPAVDRRRLQRGVVSRLGNVSDWRRLFRGEIHPDRVKIAGRSVISNLFFNGNREQRHEWQIPKEKMRSAWRTIEQRNAFVTFVFSDAEPLLEEMIAEDELPPPNNARIRCLQVGRAGHTFQPIWAQKLLRELLDDEFSRIIQGQGSSQAQNRQRVIPQVGHHK